MLSSDINCSMMRIALASYNAESRLCNIVRTGQLVSELPLTWQPWLQKPEHDKAARHTVTHQLLWTLHFDARLNG